jgi:hypothetical protein
MTIPRPLVAAPVRWNISFPVPRPFHPGACKSRQRIADQCSITPSSTAAAASPQSSAAISSQRSSKQYPPPKPLPAKSP